MSRFVGWKCRWLGHAYEQSRYFPRYYVCRRCGDPGFWVPDSE